MALFNPRDYRIDEHLGYNVEAFTNSEGYNRFRSAFVLKNTYGPDDFGAGFHFIGEIGKYSLLDKASNFNKYRQYANVEKSDNIIDITKR